MNNYRNSNRKNRFKPNGDRSFRKRSLNGHKNQNEFSPNSILSIEIQVEIIKMLVS